MSPLFSKEVKVCVVVAISTLFGCGVSTTPSTPVMSTITDSEPGIIEIGKVDVKVNDENLAEFKIHYKFTSGRPAKYYMCNILFPGSERRGLKPIEKWEMKPEGIIIAKIDLGADNLDAFTIQLEEADSPDKGYTANSNLYEGKLKS